MKNNCATKFLITTTAFITLMPGCHKPEQENYEKHLRKTYSNIAIYANEDRFIESGVRKAENYGKENEFVDDLKEFVERDMKVSGSQGINRSIFRYNALKKINGYEITNQELTATPYDTANFTIDCIGDLYMVAIDSNKKGNQRAANFLEINANQIAKYENIEVRDALQTYLETSMYRLTNKLIETPNKLTEKDEAQCANLLSLTWQHDLKIVSSIQKNHEEIKEVFMRQTPGTPAESISQRLQTTYNNRKNFE